MKIIAIGREEFSSNNGDWTNGKNIPVLVDPLPHNTWSNWEAYQRALFFLDISGEYVTDFTITPWNYGGDIDDTDLVYFQIRSILDNVLIMHSHPTSTSLLHAYPNPFNPIINIAFSMDVGTYNNMTIFNLKGTPIENFPNTYYSPGSYVLQWDASDLASGIYIINFRAGTEIYNKKIVLAK